VGCAAVLAVMSEVDVRFLDKIEDPGHGDRGCPDWPVVSSAPRASCSRLLATPPLQQLCLHKAPESIGLSGRSTRAAATPQHAH
jgi:hypothetical protein